MLSIRFFFQECYKFAPRNFVAPLLLCAVDVGEALHIDKIHQVVVQYIAPIPPNEYVCEWLVNYTSTTGCSATLFAFH